MREFDFPSPREFVVPSPRKFDVQLVIKTEYAIKTE